MNSLVWFIGSFTSQSTIFQLYRCVCGLKKKVDHKMMREIENIFFRPLMMTIQEYLCNLNMLNMCSNIFYLWVNCFSDR